MEMVDCSFSRSCVTNHSANSHADTSKGIQTRANPHGGASRYACANAAPHS